MGKLTRRVAACVSALLVVTALSAGFGVSTAAAATDAENAPNPEFWPVSPTVSPRVSGYANAVRFAGPDRYSTSLALVLALRGTGGFPFESPVRQSPGATSLAQNHNWWGAATCPRSVIIVAGDNPADALAASALSDPTGSSTEPYLQRSAAADPLFDPIGGFSKIDTDNAPIIVTASGRSGASLLSPAANLAVRDMVNGGCGGVWQAIVVGGAAAVPSAVDAELVSLGIPEVFRINGANRFATAAAIANSLGTAPVPTSTTDCLSPTATTSNTQMGFYANSVVEYRSSATECDLLGRTVVLADGMVGADALAAGWWTSFWQTPILLHGGAVNLPDATAIALETLNVDTIIALGGTARIPQLALDEAVALTGATAIRVSGATRYETSLAMARHFGGWWSASEAGVNPGTPIASSFANSMVCFAASSGEGVSARGWPDALGAGPLCASLHAAVLAQNSTVTSAPSRVLAPSNGVNPIQTPARGSEASKPGHEAVPIILVPAAQSSTTSTVPSSVAQFLTDIFSDAQNWCSSTASTVGCINPGFAVLVGGEAAINQASANELSFLVGGGVAGTSGANAKVGLAPRLTGGFYTTIDMAPVFDVSSTAVPNPAPLQSRWFCMARGEYEDLRWLAAFPSGAINVPLASLDVIAAKKYVSDSNTVARSVGVGAPICMALPDGGIGGLQVLGISATGRTTPVGQTKHLSPVASMFYSIDNPVELAGTSSASGVDSSLVTPIGGVTTFTFTTANPTLQNPAPMVTSLGISEPLVHASITLKLTRGSTPPIPPGLPSPGPTMAAAHTFTGSWSIATQAGTVSGQASGEAIFDAGVWKLRGTATAAGGTWNVPGGSGGFSADIATNSAGSLNDDAISWRLDGLISN